MNLSKYFVLGITCVVMESALGGAVGGAVIDVQSSLSEERDPRCRWHVILQNTSIDILHTILIN